MMRNIVLIIGLVIGFSLTAYGQRVTKTWSSGEQSSAGYSTTFSGGSVTAISVSNQTGGELVIHISYETQSTIDTLRIPDCHTYSSNLNADRYDSLYVASVGGVGVYNIIGARDNRGAYAASNLVELTNCGFNTGMEVSIDELTDSVSMIEQISHEIYRVDGAETGTSTAATAPASTPTTGNTVTITAPYKSIAWRFMRDSPQDPNDGTLGSLTINGFVYYSGTGDVYTEDGFSISATRRQEYSNDMKFDVTGTAVVEIIVIR